MSLKVRRCPRTIGDKMSDAKHWNDDCEHKKKKTNKKNKQTSKRSKKPVEECRGERLLVHVPSATLHKMVKHAILICNDK